jgi:hypothetical protein
MANAGQNYRVRQTGLGKEWLNTNNFYLGIPVPTPYCSNIYYREFVMLIMVG